MNTKIDFETRKVDADDKPFVKVEFLFNRSQFEAMQEMERRHSVVTGDGAESAASFRLLGGLVVALTQGSNNFPEEILQMAGTFGCRYMSSEPMTEEDAKDFHEKQLALVKQQRADEAEAMAQEAGGTPNPDTPWNG